MRTCRGTADGSLLRACPRDHEPAALHEGGRDDLRSPGGADPRRDADAGRSRKTTDAQLREAGYSRQKTAYLRDLSAHVLDGRLDLRTIHDLPDEEVIAALTNVKGIGRWSAEMFLMFRLHRPDVLPVGDLGIVNAIRTQYRLRKAPTPERIRRIGEAWKPYRSVACWYLWRSLDNEP